jgi:C-terminal processing protease CtpA/Prc
MRRRPLILLVLLVFAGLAPARPQLVPQSVVPPSVAPARPGGDVERLTHLGKLWGTVRYLHPFLAYREIDWDGALVRSIPVVRAAKTPAEYAAAVQTMLAALGDPMTRVERAPAPPVESSPKPPPLFRVLDDGTLAIHLRPDLYATDEKALYASFKALAAALPKATAVIVDVRGMGYRYAAESLLKDFANLLASRPVTAPAQRYRFHSGFRTQLGTSSGGYDSGFQTVLAERFEPPAGTAAKRVVFLVNADTVLPPIAMALQAAGDGAVVSEGELREDAFVNRRVVDLGEGWTAVVRTAEVLPRPGWSGPRADAVVATEPNADPAFAAALRLSREGWPQPLAAAQAVALPDAVWRPDPRYDAMTEPSLEYRLLAVFEVWNVFDSFFPYFALTADWSPVLPEFIARMEQVRDGREYALAMAGMAARVNDGHVSLTGNPTLDALYGPVPAPLAVRWIENAWVVTDVADAAKAAGVAVGDVVLALDGAPIATREGALRHVFAAATEAGMHRKLADRLLSGADGSELGLSLRGQGGTAREARLTRGAWKPHFAGETVRILPGNLGYVDLGRLTTPEVAGMFERLKETRGLILDMRAYPNGTAWAIAPYLNTRGATRGPLFRRRLLMGVDGDELSVDFVQAIPAYPVPPFRYQGRTVMLIDERTVSQAEHSGLFFEAANGTKFIGSQTAGTDGDVTYFAVPGIASVRFSGHDVRHPDGRQLQRIGLVPDVPVAPTIQGIREGRDEVLERAERYLEEEVTGTNMD